MRSTLALAGLACAIVLLSPGQPTCRGGEVPPGGTIAFASLAPRGWDLYLVDLDSRRTRRLTDHAALDFNAAFSPDGSRLAFVSERDGNAELYVMRADGSDPRRLTDDFALDDHPAWSPDGRRIAFSSTRQPSDEPGRAWNVVFIMDADGGSPDRLTPAGSADYSPAWSPTGELIAVASGSGEAGGTDLFVMAPDGSGRRHVVADGGWPAFAADGKSLFFHSRRQGKWGIWRVGLDGSGLERVTPPDLDAYTPSACADGVRLVATASHGGDRQVVLIDLASRSMTDLTDEKTDHWNPTIAPDGRWVVYHKTAPDAAAPNVELWGTPPGTELKLLRLAGAFPAFSPDGRRIALTGGSFERLDVMNVDGSDRRTIHLGTSRALFSVSWAHQGDRIAFSHGPVFQGPGGQVDIATIRPDGSGYAELTRDPGNDGFPSFSPDGRRLVFRSGRGGSKNLYVMVSARPNQPCQAGYSSGLVPFHQLRSQFMARPRDPGLERTWRQRLERQSTSGLSISAFCTREGVSSTSFHAWKRRLTAPSLRGRPQPPVFVPLHLVPEAPEGSPVPSRPVELDLPHQVRLRFANPPEPEWLGRLVAALDARSRDQEAAS
jgi:Tol biopolymer transport system component